MLEEKTGEEVIEYFQEKINGKMVAFHLTRIYYTAKEGFEKQEAREKLIEIAKIQRGTVIRELIIDDNNAIFEFKYRTDKILTCIVINGCKSSNGYHTLEQGLLGWTCEKQGLPELSWHLFRMLNMEVKDQVE